MRIEEATNQLQSFTSWFALDFSDDDLDAIKLGIEALNRIKDLRERGEPCIYIPLPGETKPHP